jgi:TonB family protein
VKRACGSVREWLGAFADGELDPARAEQVRVHLETCAACRHELDHIQALHRLAKSVEHPRLAEDYWDWHRTKVWHGIRARKRAPAPSYRPSFMWPNLAAAAAGFVVVLVVVIAGWRTLLPRPGLVRPVGRLSGEIKSAAEQPVAAAPTARRSVAREEPQQAAGAAQPSAEGRSDELARVPATTRDAEKTSVGHAAKGAGATGTTAASEPAAAPVRRSEDVEMKVAAEERGRELASAPSTGGPHVRASAEKQKSRIVSGPVLLDQPPLADADALDTGTVLLSVKTDTAGRVLSAGVRRSSGSPKLDSVAVRQIRQSRFKAAVRKNRSVPSTFDYPYRFQKKPVKPQEQQKPQTEKKQREVQKPPVQQIAPAEDGKSQKPDSGKSAAPVKQKTKK